MDNHEQNPNQKRKVENTEYDETPNNQQNVVVNQPENNDGKGEKKSNKGLFVFVLALIVIFVIAFMLFFNNNDMDSNDKMNEPKTEQTQKDDKDINVDAPDVNVDAPDVDEEGIKEGVKDGIKEGADAVMDNN